MLTFCFYIKPKRLHNTDMFFPLTSHIHELSYYVFFETFRNDDGTWKEGDLRQRYHISYPRIGCYFIQ